jgi:transposase
MYEALRAYFVGECSAAEAAERFGYSRGTFYVMCHHFRRDPAPVFFVSPLRGPQEQPKKSAAREMIIALRKRNYSVYEISEALGESKTPLSPTAVGEVLREEGFSRLPRRLDEERPARLRPTAEAVADVRSFQVAQGKFVTKCGGLFLFLPDLVALDLDGLAKQCSMPGSKMIPAGNALRACLALKLWAVERKSHVMSLVSDAGLALCAGLNVIPKKSYFSEYSGKVDPRKIAEMISCWVGRVADRGTLPGESFNLDFHSVPYYGDDPVVEKHYVSMRSRRQKSILTFLAQDAATHAFCYSNADLRKGEESDEVFHFIEFWKRTRGALPQHLVFDSQLTTYAALDRLDEMGVKFITLRRRSPAILKEIALLPASAWPTVELNVPGRKYRTPKVYEKKVVLATRELRQLYIKDLGHDEPTVLLTNDRKRSLSKLITRYAQRMLIENALSDAVRFFHMDALSSVVGLKVDFDMALLVIASGLYRRLANQMRGYSDAQARKIFRDLIDIPADVKATAEEVTVRLHSRTHLPIIRASGLLDSPVPIPWWNGTSLRITA